MTLAEIIEARSIPEPNSGCWLWIGSIRNDQGYGCLRLEGRTRSAHRSSWISKHGPIPPGLLVCHKCDVPACVNPDHLFLGTYADNAGDMKKKGRCASPIGEKQGGHKLKEGDIREILAEPTPLTMARSRELAAKYRISRTYLYDIRAGISWGHLSGKQSPRKRAPLFDRLEGGR